MTSERPGSLDHVPTLTEVVSVPVQAAVRAEDTALPAEPGLDAARSLPSEDELTATILAGLQRQVDAVLEFRVRELLTPILNRATDAVVREAKSELARSLRDVVARSVAEEMRRQRLR